MDLVTAIQEQRGKTVPQLEVASLTHPGHRFIHRAQLHKSTQNLPAPLQQLSELPNQLRQHPRQRHSCQRSPRTSSRCSARITSWNRSWAARKTSSLPSTRV